MHSGILHLREARVQVIVGGTIYGDINITEPLERVNKVTDP